MYIPIPSFSSALADLVFPFNWLHDVMHAFVIYLAAFFAASPLSAVEVQGGEYLIGLGELITAVREG